MSPVSIISLQLGRDTTREKTEAQNIDALFAPPSRFFKCKKWEWSKAGEGEGTFQHTRSEGTAPLSGDEWYLGWTSTILINLCGFFL